MAVTGRCLFIFAFLLVNMCNINASPGYRLPDTVVPKHYIVDVVTNLEEPDFSFHGKVWIKVS